MPIALMSIDRRIDQREQNIQIVNHHVIHDINIQAARRENAEAMNFEIERAVHHGHHRDNPGIESLQVADLKDAAAARGCGKQLHRLRPAKRPSAFRRAHRCRVPAGGSRRGRARR